MTTATPKEGELMYSGMTWGERYVKMDGDKMDVYKKQADAAPHFSVGPLSECIVAGDATKHPMGLPAGTAFIVQVGKKKHIFYCMTDYEKRQWIAAIEHNIVMAKGGYDAQRAREADAQFEERKEDAQHKVEDGEVDEKKRTLLANALKFGRKPTNKEGDLQKEGESFLHAWHIRYLKLEGKTLSYWKNEMDYRSRSKPKAVIEDISTCEILEQGRCEGKHPMGMPAGSCFEVSGTGGKPWFFYAHTSGEMKVWANTIRSNVELYDAGYGNKAKEAAAKPKVVPTVAIDPDLRAVNEELSGLSGKELKALLLKHEVDASSAVEKGDLVTLARGNVGIIKELSVKYLSVREMKTALAGVGVDTSACLEKADVMAKLLECKLSLA